MISDPFPRLGFATAFLAMTVTSLFSQAPRTKQFSDVTRESGVTAAVAQHYRLHPRWWLSGVNLIDLDADGKLDLFLAAHGAGAPLALFGDNQGHFSATAGSYPNTEIHLAHDINEDGKVDLQMTWLDGGGKWWINESTPGRLSFRDSGLTAEQGRCNALIDLNRDGKVDWLHERPGIVFEFGDGKGTFKLAAHLDIAETRNEFNMHPADLNDDGFIDLVVHWGRYDLQERTLTRLSQRRQNEFPRCHGRMRTVRRRVDYQRYRRPESRRCARPDRIRGKTPTIYLADGHGHFRRKTEAIRGMERATKPAYTSWGLAVATDFDNDGIADIIWNGRNFLWLLRGTGGGDFLYVNKEWEIEDKSAASVDDGLCFGDIDGDGDLDVIGYTGTLDGQRMLNVYRNDSAGQNWLRVRPIGAPGNRGAAGAKIRVTRSDQPTVLLWFEQIQILDSQSAHSYYSLAETERHFGLGTQTVVDVSVEFYPSGKRVEKKAVAANAIITIAEDSL
jgi:hypothetical protein